MNKNTPLWTAHDLKKATKGKWLVSPPDDFAPVRVSYDLSSLNPKNIALVRNSNWRRGLEDDAPRVARLAIEGKVVAAVVERSQLKNLGNVPKDLPLLLVKNTRTALTDLCRHRRQHFEGKVIAITGTVGKTTSRQMLLHALEVQGGARATRGNNNNIAGVERTMSYTPIDAGFSIIEMGFGLPLGGIKMSSELVRPHVAFLTALGLAHIDVLGDVAADLDEALDLVTVQKMGIVEALEKGGTLVYPRGIRNRERLLEIAKLKRVDNLLTYGPEDDADVRMTSVTCDAEGSNVEVAIDGKQLSYRLQLAGKHMALNSVGVLATVLAAGGDVEVAAEELQEFEAVGGRAKLFEFQVPSGGTASMIDDSFNATPDSIRSTLALLDLQEPKPGGRRVAVFGNVEHLGPKEVDVHRAFAADIDNSKVDVVFTVGNLMRHLFVALPEEKRGAHVENAKEALAVLRRDLKPGDVVTLKAATPIALTKVARALRDGRQTL